MAASMWQSRRALCSFWGKMVMLIRPMDTFYVVLKSSDIRLCSFGLHFERRKPNFDRNVPSTFRRVRGCDRGFRGLGRIEGEIKGLLARKYPQGRRGC